MPANPELARLLSPETESWRLWGSYLSERQWGTVREDYSANGNAWAYLSHDQARSKSYRWGEEGIGGLCDLKQYLCFAPAFWNHRDPIIKERLFGLSGVEGNHGEDVKELYFYLDNTPTHSYMRMNYKYPINRFPYEVLVEENQKAGKHKPEFELLDTGVFAKDNYFDIDIEYFKVDSKDNYINLTVTNRSSSKAKFDFLAQLWFRNIWAWEKKDIPKPKMHLSQSAGFNYIDCHHPKIGKYFFISDEPGEILFCENETNHLRLYNNENKHKYLKDGINDYVVSDQKCAINPDKMGTKCAYLYRLHLGAGEKKQFKLRLSDKRILHAFEDFEQVRTARLREADLYYSLIQERVEDEDLLRIQRQAYAGLLWSKQYYYFEIEPWLEGDPCQPSPPPQRKSLRNADWRHLYNSEVISMPDKWEYPWYAAWDLAFHCLPLAHIDPEFAKNQLVLMTREWYMHPNGQLPAYEWEFSDVNPPVHAWASWRVYQIERKARGGKGDLSFLERVFHKLLLNFTWWVNRKDAAGHNLFQGGFLGLDNIGVFDRSSPLPTGGYLAQSDGTSWMAMYSLNMMRISLELARFNPIYQDIASKFFEHFLEIAQAMTNFTGNGLGLWDDEDKFYYDVLMLPDGNKIPLKVRSIVGLIPLFAVETIEPETLKQLPEFGARLEWFMKNKPELAYLVSRWNEPGRGNRRLLSLLRGHRFKKLLKRMLNPDEFFSDYGIRALSKEHEEAPYIFKHGGKEIRVGYEPAESSSYMFGGNSNWRGPVWFPINFLIIEALQKFHHYYGDDFKVECPTGSGKYLTILEIAEEISRRLIRIFLEEDCGKRPVHGDYSDFFLKNGFKDKLLFYEYFHGDNGRGAGASHQTGWTALVAKLIKPREDRTKSHRAFMEQHF